MGKGPSIYDGMDWTRRSQVDIVAVNFGLIERNILFMINLFLYKAYIVMQSVSILKVPVASARIKLSFKERWLESLEEN